MIANSRAITAGELPRGYLTEALYVWSITSKLPLKGGRPKNRDSNPNSRDLTTRTPTKIMTPQLLEKCIQTSVSFGQHSFYLSLVAL